MSYPRSRRFGSLFGVLVLAGLGLFLSVQGSIPAFAESSDNNLPTGGVTINGPLRGTGGLEGPHSRKPDPPESGPDYDRNLLNALDVN